MENRGQSFTEIAIIIPLLIVIMIGGVEVGWALRSYLVLGNVNREITRFAVRPNYLDFSSRNASSVGYERVLTHTYTVLSDQLPLDFSSDGNSSLIIHHLVIDTGYPCPPDQMAGCDCASFSPENPEGGNPYTVDDVVLSPNTSGYEYFRHTFPLTGSAQSRLDYENILTELTAANNALNCKLLKQDPAAIPSTDNLIITELFYNQPHLLGFPLISNRLTDPVQLYTQTSMRLNMGEKVVTQGPVCAVLPITFHQNIFPDPNNPRSNVVIDAFESDAPGNFGWLYWDPSPAGTQGNTTLIKELQTPRMAHTAFTDAYDYHHNIEPPDTALSVGDYVDAATGVQNSSQLQDALAAYVGQTVLIPVHDNAPGSGTNAHYHVAHFARIIINNICLPANAGDTACGRRGEKRINAIFLEYADDACYDPSDS